LAHSPSTTTRLQHGADRKGSSQLANLPSSFPSRRTSDSEDHPEDHAPSDGQRMLSSSASSSRVSMAGSITSSINRLLTSRGYAMPILSHTDFTMSGIPGPGRTFGKLLWGAGRRLEPVLNQMALSIIGTLSGSYVLQIPNRARLVIDRVHIETLRRSWTKFADPKTGLVERSNLACLLSVSTLCSGVA
jgi:hypothetical protein